MKDKNFKIRRVVDKDINHYLFCRNLTINKKMSSALDKVSALDHYIWWFNSNRESYILTEKNKKILYFYDEELFISKNKKYFLSGWFSCENNCSIRHILYALNWQKNLKRNVVWLSFVKKTNILAVKYSKYIGWKLLKKDKKIIFYLKKRFKIKLKNFIFYIRKV